uniref:Uncharacterized protein n=1 Tax=Anguilla anguilla TaxID=7936 RepID=A0A0E9U364_ANGAN
MPCTPKGDLTPFDIISIFNIYI